MNAIRYAVSYLLFCNLTIVACAWSESVSAEMAIKAMVIKSCRMSTTLDLLTAGLIRNREWIGPTLMDNHAGSCPTGSLPQIIVEPKSSVPNVHMDSLNGLPEYLRNVIRTEVTFTTIPTGIGAKATHRLVQTPRNSNLKLTSEIGFPAESAQSGEEQSSLTITIHF